MSTLALIAFISSNIVFAVAFSLYITIYAIWSILIAEASCKQLCRKDFVKLYTFHIKCKQMWITKMSFQWKNRINVKFLKPKVTGTSWKIEVTIFTTITYPSINICMAFTLSWWFVTSLSLGALFVTPTI